MRMPENCTEQCTLMCCETLFWSISFYFLAASSRAQGCLLISFADKTLCSWKQEDIISVTVARAAVQNL